MDSRGAEKIAVIGLGYGGVLIDMKSALDPKTIPASLLYCSL